jgi:hypothetical protein
MNAGEAIALLRTARTPGEVFGTDPGAAAHIYRQLAKMLHPDISDAPGAASAFARLASLWAGYTGNSFTLASDTHVYRIGRLIERGDVTNSYEATFGDPPATNAVLTIARVPSDNDLMTAEATALRRIRAHGDVRARAYVPDLIESFSYREPDSGVQRVANVLARVDGFVSLADVTRAYAGGIDPRDAAWMWRRLLVAIGHAHRAGVIHGAVLPDHVLIQPEQHGLILAGWHYAAIGGARVPALVDRYASWYPIEVMKGEKPSAGTDIHLATKCITALMGKRIPAALAGFARGCTLPTLAARPDDAWQVLAELDDLLQRLYGPRTFRPFAMPQPAGAN